MSSALIGYSGFVGTNLRVATTFDHLYNSRNIEESHSHHFDLVVFSAARAEKWRINQDPEADSRHMAELRTHLRHITADRIVLISTVDVYGTPRDVDEHSLTTPVGLHAYGAHRLELEDFVSDTFENSHILRLPGLFGRGLKKNVIYDLLHDNNTERIHADGSFQYYDLSRLWGDMTLALRHDLPLVNITSEPIATSELAREVFGLAFENRPPDSKPVSYDIRSVHAGLWGRNGGYLYSREQVLADLRAFVNSEQS